MISSHLREVVARARAAIPLELEWSMYNSVPAGLARSRSLDAPVGYADFLSVADGVICGRIGVFSSKEFAELQLFADVVEDAPVQLGRESWFCFGKVVDDPLFIKRADGSVWGFPDIGISWYDSDVFVQYSVDFSTFVEDCVFGSRYREVTGAPGDDQWWRLLIHIGRAG